MPARRSRRDAWGTVVVMCVIVQCCSVLMPWPAWGAGAGGAGSATLVWDAPGECPDAARVEARLRELSSPLRNGQQGRRIRGVIRRGERSGWTLSLEIASSPGAVSRRLITAEQCDELADAAALAIAIAVGDEAAPPQERAQAAEVAALDGSTSRPGSEEALNSVADSPEIEDEAGVLARAARARRPGVGVAASLVADSGTVSALALGASLVVRARWESWNLGAYGFWLPQHEELVAADQGVQFSLLAGGGRACQAVSESLFELAACLGLELGAVRAVSRGLLSGRDRQDSWLAPTIGLELGWRALERLALTSRLEAAVPLGHERYVVDRDEIVHVTPDVVLRWSLGIEADVISSR